jgi:hypothetical protein
LSPSDNQGPPLSDNQKAATTKNLPSSIIEPIIDLATGRRFTLRLPQAFSSRLSRYREAIEAPGGPQARHP